MRGRSLLPLLSNEAPRVHPPDEPIGYELGGNAALFKGELEIVADRGPIGDGEWHLFNHMEDPSEASDLKDQMPELFTEMLDDYRSYARDNNVVPIPDGYDQRTEVILYTIRNNPSPTVLAAAALLALLVSFLSWRRVRLLIRAQGHSSAALFFGVLLLVAQTRAEPAKVPTPSELAGEYAYAGNREKDEAAIKAKVDAATVDMSRMVSKRALPRLESSTRIPPTVMIAHQGGKVTFKMNDHVVTVPENGGSVPVTTPLGETADASLDVKTATLLQSVAKTGGEKRNTFRFNETGQLVMDVRVTNNRLASPVAFSLLYARSRP